MYRWTRSGCLAVAVILSTSLALADEPSAVPPAAGDSLDPDALARKAEALIGVVLEQHIDPPTRQEMWLRGIKALFESGSVTAPADLSTRMSRLTEPDQFRELLHEIWPPELTRRPRARAATEQLAHSFFNGLVQASGQYEARLISATERNAQEQLGANRYVGTGIALAYDVGEQLTIIAKVMPGGPMERAGGRDGDRILKIDDEDARGLEMTAVIE